MNGPGLRVLEGRVNEIAMFGFLLFARFLSFAAGEWDVTHLNLYFKIIILYH